MCVRQAISYHILLLAGVVRRIDVRDPPWPHPAQLDDGFLAGPAEVVHFRFHDGDTARWQRCRFGLVERVPPAQVQCPGKDGDSLSGRMPVCRHLID
jgi:hypothetical protein